MSRAEEFPLLVSDTLRERVTSDLELTLAVKATEATPMEEDSIGRHSLHEVDTLVAEVAEVTRVCRRGFEAEGRWFLVPSPCDFRGGVWGGLGWWVGGVSKEREERCWSTYIHSSLNLNC